MSDYLLDRFKRTRSKYSKPENQTSYITQAKGILNAATLTSIESTKSDVIPSVNNPAIILPTTTSTTSTTTTIPPTTTTTSTTTSTTTLQIISITDELGNLITDELGNLLIP